MDYAMITAQHQVERQRNADTLKEWSPYEAPYTIYGRAIATAQVHLQCLPHCRFPSTALAIKKEAAFWLAVANAANSLD